MSWLDWDAAWHGMAWLGHDPDTDIQKTQARLTIPTSYDMIDEVR